MARLLQAISQDQSLTNLKLDEILALLSKPIKIDVTAPSAPVSTPIGMHPRTGISFYTEDPVDRGQFEVTCDRPCAPVDTCLLQGANPRILATVADQPTLAEFLFQRQFPALTQCSLIVESRDDKPVQIINLTISNRIKGLIPNAVQPSHCVDANGSMLC